VPIKNKKRKAEKGDSRLGRWLGKHRHGNVASLREKNQIGGGGGKTERL